MVYEEAPQGWNPRYEVVSCFVEHDGAILLLHRRDHKPEGGKWGVPAGKIDAGESPVQALLRELAEETGLEVPIGAVRFLKKVYVRNPSYDFVYYMYTTTLEAMPHIRINQQEHQSFVWKTPHEALTFALVRDMDTCIKMVYAV